MDSQRSKSFKALSMAQPIRSDIQQTLNKLQQQKRRYLAFDREETLLKSQLEAKRKNLNSLKSKVPETVVDEKRTSQTSLMMKNTDRTYEITMSNIQKLKDAIDVNRRQVQKYKTMNKNLADDHEKLVKAVEKLIEDIVKTEQDNHELKEEILNYRQINIKNLTEFRKSHMTLTKSNVRDENDRRKYAVSTRSFLGEEVRQSRLVHFETADPNNEGNQADLMTDSIPLARARVKFMIHKNKEKIKIAEDYQKFGEGLQDMFAIMKVYKGRDDEGSLAEQFVAKEKQIEKLGQYIGKLEYRIVSSNRQVDKKLNKDLEMEKEMTTDTENQINQQYIDLNAHVQQDLEQLKRDQAANLKWMERVGQILCPLAGDTDFSYGNCRNVIGKIEEKLKISRDQNLDYKRQASPTKQATLPVIEVEEGQRYNELMDYEKLKDYADEYVKARKAV